MDFESATEPLAGPEPGRRRGPLRSIVVVLLVGLFGSGLYGLGRAQGLSDSPDPIATDEPAAAVAERLAPSVVRIEHDGGQGSGIVYDDDGLILTAGHVVRGTSEVTMRTSEDASMTGEVLGIDPETDIAVVRAKEALPVPELAEGIALQVGQLAIAIGSPYGLDESVTMGIVSALDRSVTTDAGTIDGVIQTDAPINPGNSGGPLANKDGQVIGINHAIATRSGGNEGVGFAIPIDAALSSARKILNGEGEDPTDNGFMPDLEFPDEPFGGMDEFPEHLPGLPEGLRRACEPGWFEHPPFDGLPGFRFDPPDVPLPRHVPEGYETRSVTTNTTDSDDDTDVLHEIELVSSDHHITISLGNVAPLTERTADLAGQSDAQHTSVNGGDATVIVDGGRSYLVFDYEGLTGLIDAPDEVPGDELVRIAESIRG
ncbi:MAG TPA: trypsin-like peptidase domain-containing protein [Actinomycetota bacterium]|nr:trypsin-like peptidase domain-containing protein [Actinomycetota bacterium]